MTAYTPPPTPAQFHAAYWRVRDELDRTRARIRAEQAAEEEERNRPTQEPPEGSPSGQ